MAGMGLEVIEFLFWIPEVLNAINGNSHNMNYITWTTFFTGVMSFYFSYQYVKTGTVSVGVHVYSYVCLIGYLTAVAILMI